MLFILIIYRLNDYLELKKVVTKLKLITTFSILILLNFIKLLFYFFPLLLLYTELHPLF